MGKVILDMAMSVDGIVTDKKGNYLYPINELKNSEELNDLINNVGAVVMDKACYDMAGGDFTNYEYQAPIFIFTKTVPKKVAKGENDKLTFTFVTNNIKETVAKAKKAAKKKNVMIVGWVGAAQQCFKNGLIDEIIIRVMPVLIGKGKKLLENFGTKEIMLETIDTKVFSTRTDLKFIIKK